MSSGGASLQPTFTGHVATTQDALLLFEACLQGHLSHVPRRPHDRERSSLIRSGSVFIYEENASGIKRWTDGVLWSPSRILGNFLVYRELDKPFPPGQKKKAFQKNKRRPSRPGEPYARPHESNNGYSPNASQTSSFGGERQIPEEERVLIGSLVDSYEFKREGLVKKTMSVTVQGVTHHLVSYYNVNDVLGHNLRTPSQTETLQYVRPRLELTTKQSFRAPIEEGDDLDGMRSGHPGHYGYRMGPPGYLPNQYYMQPTYAHMPPQGPAGAYAMSMPPMAQPYIQTPVPQRPNEYTPYAQTTYNRSYETINNHTPAAVNSSLPPMADRTQTQQQPMYPHSSMSSKQVANVSPMANTSPYARGSYNMAPEHTTLDGPRQAEQPQTVKYEDRESANMHAPMYTGQRQPYYADASAAPPNPTQYHPLPTMPPWSNPNHITSKMAGYCQPGPINVECR